jgi:hypothetical protein
VEPAPPGSLAGLPSGGVAAGLGGPARPAAEDSSFSRHFCTLWPMQAAKRKSWLGEFWWALAALLLWVLGMVPLIAAPPLLSSLAETRVGGLTAFPADCIPAVPLFSSDLTRACGPPLYDLASGCSVAANSGKTGGELMKEIIADAGQLDLLKVFNAQVKAGGEVTIPAGLSRATLERAKEIARLAVESGKGGPIQQTRLDAITKALDGFK